MRNTIHCPVLLFVFIILVSFSAIPNSAEITPDYGNSVHEIHDPNNRIINTTPSNSLTVTVLTTIMNLLLNEINENINATLKKLTAITGAPSTATGFPTDIHQYALENITKNGTDFDTAGIAEILDRHLDDVNSTEAGGLDISVANNRSIASESDVVNVTDFGNLHLTIHSVGNLSDTPDLFGNLNTSTESPGNLASIVDIAANTMTTTWNTTGNGSIVIPDEISHPNDTTAVALDLIGTLTTAFSARISSVAAIDHELRDFPTPPPFVNSTSMPDISIMHEDTTVTVDDSTSTEPLSRPNADASKVPQMKCSYRSSKTLSSSENEDIITLRIDTHQKWSRKFDMLFCQAIREALCQFLERSNGSSRCGDVKLHIIDSPTQINGTEILVHLLVNGLNPDDTTTILEGQLTRFELTLADLLENRTTHSSQQTTHPSAAQPSDHPLDNPVIATTLIAIVISVFLVSLLSLSVLVFLQRRRRGRKGEWIVNKADSTSGYSGHQLAYGWFFENEAYSNDEKKRTTASVPVQLLDERRRKVALPVDNVHGSAEAFPVPSAPTHEQLNSFNGGCGNGFHTHPRGKPGNSFNGWQVDGQTTAAAEEMEMTETAEVEKPRWL